MSWRPSGILAPSRETALPGRRRFSASERDSRRVSRDFPRPGVPAAGTGLWPSLARFPHSPRPFPRPSPRALVSRDRCPSLARFPSRPGLAPGFLPGWANEWPGPIQRHPSSACRDTPEACGSCPGFPSASLGTLSLGGVAPAVPGFGISPSGPCSRGFWGAGPPLLCSALLCFAALLSLSAKAHSHSWGFLGALIHCSFLFYFILFFAIN